MCLSGIASVCFLCNEREEDRIKCIQEAYQEIILSSLWKVLFFDIVATGKTLHLHHNII